MNHQVPDAEYVAEPFKFKLAPPNSVVDMVLQSRDGCVTSTPKCDGSHNNRLQTSARKNLVLDLNASERSRNESGHHTSKAKQSWLLRLFESKLFDMSLAITYLFNSKEQGVQVYIGKAPAAHRA